MSFLILQVAVVGMLADINSSLTLICNIWGGDSGGGGV